MDFNITLAEDHESYDIVIAEFSVQSDEAYSIINAYVPEPERSRLLNKILACDEHLSERQRHIKDLAELDEILANVGETHES